MHTASITIRRRLAAVAPIVVAGLALVGCGGASAPSTGGATEPGATESAAGSETAPAEQAPAEEAQPAVGQTVSIDGWDFTVVSVGAIQESVGAAPFGNDAAGVYLPVTVTITNTSNEAQFLSSDAVAVLDANGAEYSSDSIAAIYDDAAIQLGELNPGITLTGPVYFDVPDGTVATAVTFSGGLFGGEVITVAL